MSLTNVELLQALKQMYTNSNISKLTGEIFTREGVEKLLNFDRNTFQEFWQLTNTWYLQVVNIPQVKNPLLNSGFGETFDNPWGAYTQRMAVMPLKSVSPAYFHLQNGSSVDPYVVRKPAVEERFFAINFNYQNFYTMPDDFTIKNIFTSERGISEFFAGITASLNNEFDIVQYDMTLNAFSNAINSVNNPLQETQQVESPLTYNMTAEELKSFSLTVKDTISAMTVGPATGAFNSLKYRTIQDKSRLKLLVRTGIKNAMNVNVLSSAFNPDYIDMGVDIIEVPHFGGLIPYQDVEFATPLYPVYDTFGALIGYNTKENQTAVTVEEHDVFWKDPNEKVDAILADKGWLFYTKRNPYEVEPIRNPRGRYTNFWASSPNNSVNIDPLYNCVVFRRETD